MRSLGDRFGRKYRLDRQRRDSAGAGHFKPFEVEVFTRLVYAPLNVKAEKKLNRSLSQSEYINVLSWQAHPNNVNIAKYKLFQVEGTTPRLLVELSAEALKYWHRNVRTDQDYTYVLVAVNNTNRESDPVYITVQK
jgi:hypothetical protein